MDVQVLAFGIAKDIFGKAAITITTKDADVESLKLSLEEQYPGLKTLSCYMIAVNDEYATADTTLQANDEIAIIPPVSGG